jgi:hypothetical protein
MFPIVFVALNSLSDRMEVGKIIVGIIGAWTILFLLKPIKNKLSGLLIFAQSLVFLSVIQHLNPNYRMGIELIAPFINRTSTFIYDHLGGNLYIDFINWLRAYLSNSRVDMVEGYHLTFQYFIIVAVVAVIAELLEKRVDWKYFLFGSIYFIVSWFIYVDQLTFFFSIYFVGMTLYKQFGSYEEVVDIAKEKKQKTRYYNYNAAMIVGGVIMTLIIVISSIAVKYVPIESINKQLDKVVPTLGSIRTEFRSFGGVKTFSFSKTMYSPNGSSLGGPIFDRDYSLVMRVEAPVGGLYLRGRTKNVYTGSSWKSDYNQYRKNVIIGNIDQDIPTEELIKVTIHPDEIKTRTLFAPYLYFLSSYNRNDVFGNQDKIFYVKDDLNTEYEPYNIFFVKDEFVYKYDVLEEEFRDSYLQLPNKGLERTTQLAKEITEGIEDPNEKMEALVNYLRENYRYTLNTQIYEGDLDFVEHFLFEEEMGYCTYFATSLAVMGRAVDVPTRYVEGYKTSDYRDIDGYYEVTANRAHSWVEAYVEGEGWKTYEPTPAYSSTTIVQERDEDDFLFDTDVDLEDFTLSTDDQEAAEAQESGGVVEEKVDYTLYITLALYILGFAAVSLIIYKKAKRLRDDIELGNPSEKINRRIGYMLSMASLVDISFNASELPAQVLDRICDEVVIMECPPIIQKMISESLYSQKEFTEDDFRIFNNFFEGFEYRIKKKLNLIGYSIHKYLLNTLYHRDYYR